MKINWYAIAFLLVVLVVAVSAWPDARTFLWQEHLGMTNSATSYGQAKVKFSEVTVAAQVPLSADLQAKGLGGRTGLGQGEGMVWIYDQAGEYRFWMKDMLIALDFVWIDRGQIVDLTANVPPPTADESSIALPTYQPRVPASAVLEVKAGFIADHGLSIGDPVEIDRF